MLRVLFQNVSQKTTTTNLITPCNRIDYRIRELAHCVQVTACERQSQTFFLTSLINERPICSVGGQENTFSPDLSGPLTSKILLHSGAG